VYLGAFFAPLRGTKNRAIASIPQPPSGASGISALSLALLKNGMEAGCYYAAAHRAQRMPHVEQMRPGFSQGSARQLFAGAIVCTNVAGGPAVCCINL
jgi:hypothetical protein